MINIFDKNDQLAMKHKCQLFIASVAVFAILSGN